MSIPRGVYPRKKLAGAIAYYGDPITGDIIEITPGVCDYQNPAEKCSAVGTYQLVMVGATVSEIQWETSAGAITSGQGTDTVTVTIDSGFTSDFELTVSGTVTPDDILVPPYFGSGSRIFTHTNTDISTPLTITDIVLDSGGSCFYQSGGGCQAISTYSVATSDGNGEKSYSWTITGDASIQGATTESTVTTIGILDDDADTYNLTCEVTDNTASPSLTKEFTDTKQLDPPISITSINRDSGGTCDYLTNGTCSARSVYSVSYTGDSGVVGYSWSVDNGATIIGNSALSTVTVDGTNTDTDDSYNVTCVVTDDNSTDNASELFVDVKSESDIDPNAWASIQSAGTQVNGLASNDLTVVAVQSNALAARSDDSGRNWVALPVGLNSGATTENANAVASNGDVFVAVFNGGYAARSDDDGLTWTALPQGLDIPVTTTSFYAIDASDSGVWIVGGDAGYSSRSDDNGITWTALPQDLNSGGTGRYIPSLATNKQGIWVVGFELGYASRSDDDGLTWTALPVGLNSGNDNGWYSNSAMAALENTFVCGQNGGFASISDDFGATWSQLEPGLSSGTNTETIYALEPSTTGAFVSGLGAGYASFSVDRGHTWTALTRGLNSGSTTDSLLALTKSDAAWIASFANGYTSRNPPLPITIVSINLDSGGSCEYEPGGTCQTTSVYSVTTMDGYETPVYEWSVSGDATISGSNTDATVTIMGLDDADNDVYDVTCTVTDYSGTDTVTTQFTDTKEEVVPFDPDAWGGLPQNLNSGGSNVSINGIDTDENGVFVQVGNSGYASRSVDGGITWNALPKGLNSASSTANIRAVKTDGNGKWIATHGGEKGSVSTDNGETWSSLTFTGLSGSFGAIDTANGTWIAMAGNGYGSRSTDNGVTWVGYTRGFDIGFYGTIAHNSLGVNPNTNTWILGCRNGQAMRSTDNGDTWVELPVYLNSGAISQNQDYIASMVCSQEGVWMNLQTAGFGSKSLDDGATWIRLTRHFGSGCNLTDQYDRWAGLETSGDGVWITGGPGGYSSITYDDGDTWAPLPRTLNSLTTVTLDDADILSLVYGDGVWVNGQYYGFASRNPAPPAVLNTDGDDYIDEAIDTINVAGMNPIIITEDTDSVNIDIDGDGVADIVIPKPEDKE